MVEKNLNENDRKMNLNKINSLEIELSEMK